MLNRLSLLLLVPWLATSWDAATWDGVQCLDDGEVTPPSKRKQISYEGVLSDLIILKMDWNTSLVLAQMAYILLSEKAGIKVSFMKVNKSTTKEASPCCSWSAVRALTAGCAGELVGAAGDLTKMRKCTEATKLPDAHMAFDVWPLYITPGYRKEIGIAKIDQPVVLTNAYKGDEGIALQADLHERVVANSGADLSYFRFYDLSFFDVGKYFNTTAEVETVAGKPPLACDMKSVKLNGFQGDHMRKYLNFTGDTNGSTHRSDGTLVAKCAGGWWYAPACRSNPKKCIPFVTFDAWMIGPTMQLAYHWRMPLALGTYDKDELRSVTFKIVAKTNVLFYEMMHAPEYSGTKRVPAKLIFPPSNRDENNRGLYKTAPEALELQRLEWVHLKHASSRASYFMKKFEVFQQELSLIIVSVGQMGMTKAACKWLRENRKRWEPWIPPSDTVCKKGEEWVLEKCTNCTAGRFSPLAGIETRCVPCQAGTVTPLAGQSSCKQCPSGRFKDESGGTACIECASGRFAESPGMRTCPNCPRGRFNPVSGQESCGICPKGAECLTSGAVSFEAKKDYYIIGNISKQFWGIDGAFSFNKISRTRDPDASLGFDLFGPYKCPVRGSCLGGSNCTLGMEGPYCGSCSKNYARSLSWKLCGVCPSAFQNFALLFIAILGVPMGLIVMDRANYVNLGNLRAVSSVVVKIFCNFFIQFAVVARNIRLQELMVSMTDQSSILGPVLMPPLAALGMGKVLENPSVAIISVPCLLADLQIGLHPVFFNVLLALTAVPFMLFVLALFIGLSCFLVRSLSTRSRHKNASLLQSSFSNAFVSAFIPGAVLTVYMLHPMVTSLALSILDCSDFDEDTQMKKPSRLLIDTYVDCEGSEYQLWSALSYLSLLLWSVGTPAVLYYVLRRTASTTGLHDNKAFRRYGFLYQGFEEDCCNYETVYMVRRVIYLWTAAIPWLSVNLRTVLLLALNLMFFVLHLNYQPYDDRAYKGLDNLDTWSYYALISCLVGRLFQLVSEDMEGVFWRGKHGILSGYLSRNDAVDKGIPTATMLAYLPVLVCTFILIFKGAYLVLRVMIWPLEGASMLPEYLAKRLDRRLHFTLVPLDGGDQGDQGDAEHAVLATSAPRLQNLLLDRGIGVRKTLHPKERELFKTICNEIVELLLKRHEHHVGKAPEIISLSSFLVQFERVFVGSIALALVNRVRVERANMQRDTWGKIIRGLGKDVLDQLHMVLSIDEPEVLDTFSGALHSDTGESIKLDNPVCSCLQKHSEILMKPVSAEEIQVALMMLIPKLLEGGDLVLRDFAHGHKGILDMFSSISWIFDSDFHEKFCNARSLRVSLVQAREAEAAQTEKLEEPDNAQAMSDSSEDLRDLATVPESIDNGEAAPPVSQPEALLSISQSAQNPSLGSPVSPERSFPAPEMAVVAEEGLVIRPSRVTDITPIMSRVGPEPVDTYQLL